MNSNESDKSRSDIFPAVGSTQTETIQFTNNFDGILRDGNGNPIQLNLREYAHQTYYEEKSYYSETGRKPKMYEFKDGKLMEVESIQWC